MERRSSTWVGFRALLCLMVATVAACGGGGGDGPDDGAVIQSFGITPESFSFAAGQTRQLRADARFTDNTSQNVTASAETSWDSSNESVVTVSASGLATAVGAGTANITAAFRGFTATTQVTVTAAAVTQIQITPLSAKVNKGLKKQLTATAIFTDSSTLDVTSTATWASLNAAVATVGNTDGSRGLVTGVADGTATISARFGGVTGLRSVVVGPGALTEIKVTPTGATVPKGGFTQPFKATGLFDDGSSSDLTSQVNWASSDTTKATISNAGNSRGVATSINAGASNITATLGSISSTAVPLNVSDETLTALTIEPDELELPIGQSERFLVVGTFSTPGEEEEDDPILEDRDVTEQAVWTSSDPLIATVSNAAEQRGLVVPQSVGGPIEISAKVGSITATADLTVTNAALTQLQIDPPTLTLPQGFTQQLTATGIFSDSSTGDQTDTVAWTSDRPTIAAVSNAADSKGVLTALNPGTANITAQRLDPVTGAAVATTVSVTITDAVLEEIRLTPATATIPQSTTQRYRAIGVFSDDSELDISTQEGLSLTSDDDNIASFDVAGLEDGEARGNAQGTVTLRASKKANPDDEESVIGTATLTVTAASIEEISVRNPGADCADATPATDVDTPLPVAFKRGFVACARFSDGSTKDVTAEASWSSQATTVMTVGNSSVDKGVATGKTAGRTVVEARLSGKLDSAPVVVNEAELSTIEVTPAALTQTASGTRPTGDGEPVLANGESLQFFAVGTFTDGITLPITDQVVWSSNNSVVTVSNADGSEGKASAAGTPFAQQVTITAQRDGVKDEFVVRRRANPPAP